MTKEELEKIFSSLKISAKEGIVYLEEKDVYPRIVYFEYSWDDIVSSSSVYESIVQYQISFKSQVPRDPKLVELKKKLNSLGYHPRFDHEYITSSREWHSYFSLDILEDVCK